MEPICNLDFIFFVGGLLLFFPKDIKKHPILPLWFRNQFFFEAGKQSILMFFVDVFSASYILRTKFLNTFFLTNRFLFSSGPGSFQVVFLLDGPLFSRPSKNFYSYTCEVDYGICTFEISKPPKCERFSWCKVPAGKRCSWRVHVSEISMAREVFKVICVVLFGVLFLRKDFSSKLYTIHKSSRKPFFLLTRPWTSRQLHVASCHDSNTEDCKVCICSWYSWP